MNLGHYLLDNEGKRKEAYEVFVKDDALSKYSTPLKPPPPPPAPAPQ